MVYESQLNTADMLELLSRSVEKDTSVGFTTCGVHRDDFSLLMNGKPIRNFGSQGQKKSFLMALKFAQYVYTSRVVLAKPLLLLDDLFDKLDSQRVKRVVEIIVGTDFGQIFISDTDRSNLSSIFDQRQVSIIQL